MSEIARFPKAVTLRSAGRRLLRSGHHAEAELLIRAAAAVRSERSADISDHVVEDLARAILSHSPVEALRVLAVLDRDEPRGTSALGLSALNLKGRILYELSRFSEAESIFRAALGSAKREGNAGYLGYVSLNHAILQFDRGNLRESLRSTDYAIRQFERAGDVASTMFAECNLAVHKLVVGRYDDALVHVDGREDEIHRLGNPWLSAFYSFIMGEVEILVGDRGRALGWFESAVRSSGEAGNPALRVRALTWKRLLEGESSARVFLGDVAAVAHDLSANGLRTDSGLLLILGARFAQAQEHPVRRYVDGAREVFGGLPSAAYFEDYYDALIRSARARSVKTPARPLPRFTTRSSAVEEVLHKVQRLARTDVRLLLEGESGTGKSFLARLTHEAAGPKRPFVVVDCTNLEENLFESKLFGHTRGAFTGAVSDSAGLVEQANGGTLFLDEIGEMPVEIQAKLLYTIEEQRYRPVGARIEKSSEFRVIAATNRDIDAMLEEGSLRRDLYFRVAGYRVRLPALRERREDVVPLVELQLERLNRRYGRRKSLRPGVWEALVRYEWPGNVRELNAALERGFHLAPGRRIAVEDLGLDRGATDGEDLTWDAIRRAHLLKVLRLCRGNVTRAAKVLDMNRTTLIYKLKQLGIERADFDPPGAAPEEEEVAEAPAPRLVADRRAEAAPREDPGGGAD